MSSFPRNMSQDPLHRGKHPDRGELVSRSRQMPAPNFWPRRHSSHHCSCPEMIRPRQLPGHRPLPQSRGVAQPLPLRPLWLNIAGGPKRRSYQHGKLNCLKLDEPAPRSSRADDFNQRKRLPSTDQTATVAKRACRTSETACRNAVNSVAGATFVHPHADRRCLTSACSPYCGSLIPPALYMLETGTRMAAASELPSSPAMVAGVY